MILIMTLMLVMIAIMTIHEADKIEMIQEEVQGDWDWLIVLYSARLLYKLCKTLLFQAQLDWIHPIPSRKKSNLQHHLISNGNISMLRS